MCQDAMLMNNGMEINVFVSLDLACLREYAQHVLKTQVLIKIEHHAFVIFLTLSSTQLHSLAMPVLPIQETIPKIPNVCVNKVTRRKVIIVHLFAK